MYIPVSVCARQQWMSMRSSQQGYSVPATAAPTDTCGLLVLWRDGILFNLQSCFGAVFEVCTSISSAPLVVLCSL